MEYEAFRGERRSFYCSNELWKVLLQCTDDCVSVSEFIRLAIYEKLRKDFGVDANLSTSDR